MEKVLLFRNKYFHLSQKCKFPAVISVSYVFAPCWGWGMQFFSRYIGWTDFFGVQKFAFRFFIVFPLVFGRGQKKFGNEGFCGYFWCYF